VILTKHQQRMAELMHGRTSVEELEVMRKANMPLPVQMNAPPQNDTQMLLEELRAIRSQLNSQTLEIDNLKNQVRSQPTVSDRLTNDV
jgi:hypothetical protein